MTQYKQCFACKKEFSNERKNGKGFIFGKQWEEVKTCSPKCGSYKRNKYKVIGDIIEVYINDEVFIIDSNKEYLLKDYCWYKQGRGYMHHIIESSNGKRSSLLIHRAVFGEIKRGLVIDHIDRDKKNNRVSNLRQVTHSQNLSNKKHASNNKFGVRGVSYSKRDKLFKIDFSYKPLKLKIQLRAKTLKEAILKRKELEEKYYPIIF